MDIKENFFESPRHKTFYLECGPEDGPLAILVHGWPELSLSWRHQLPFLAELGFHVIAPDMRGYGRSSVYDYHEAYCQEEIVTDMKELFDSFAVDNALWIGHDWGSPVVWNMALHHPDIVNGLVSLCVPYGWGGHPENYLRSIDRNVYPEDQYPYGQWDYQFFYLEHFDVALQDMEVDPHKMVKLLFTKGQAAAKNTVAPTAVISQAGGWFKFKDLGVNGLEDFHDVQIDSDVITDDEAKIFGDYLSENGLFGPNSWYMNGVANDVFSKQVQNFYIEQPVLFVHAAFDQVLATENSPMIKPMQKFCSDLTEAHLDTGHWMAQEKPDELNQVLQQWIQSNFAI